MVIFWKICDIKYARIQGLPALIQHFQSSSVMKQGDDSLKPLILMSNRIKMTSRIQRIVEQQK